MTKKEMIETMKRYGAKMDAKTEKAFLRDTKDRVEDSMNHFIEWSKKMNLVKEEG